VEHSKREKFWHVPKSLIENRKENASSFCIVFFPWISW